MYKFEMESPIIVESREELVTALFDIYAKVDSGQERDFIPGEIQCMEWTVDPGFDYSDDEYQDE